MTCLLKSKIQKFFLTLRIFLNMKLHVLYNTQVYNETGNAHKNELDEKSIKRLPPNPSERQAGTLDTYKSAEGGGRARLGYITLSKVEACILEKKLAVRMVRGHEGRAGGLGEGGGTSRRVSSSTHGILAANI